MKNSTSKINLGDSSVTTVELWNLPKRIQVIEYSDHIDMIYKQTPSVTYTVHLDSEPETRVFKIVFSCVDGKWNKSEPIYGEIVQAQDKYYKFNE